MTAQEAIEYLNMVRADYDVYYKDSPVREAFDIAIKALEEEPRIKARWKIDWDWGIATCTNCNHDYDDADNGYLLGDEMRYCPFCGAIMDGKENE